MNINQYTGFARWIFINLCEAITRTHRKFRRTMENEFFLALLLWTLIVGLFSIPVGLTAVYFTPVEQMYIVRHVMQVYVAITGGYFVYTGFSILYENYCDEQQRIIDSLRQQR